MENATCISKKKPASEKKEFAELVKEIASRNTASRYEIYKILNEKSPGRIESLFRAGGVSRQDRDNMRTRYEAMKADWEAVRQSVKVRAPISGTLTSLFVSETDNVKQKDPIAIISRTDKLKTFVWIAEKDIRNIQAGSEATARWLGTV